MANEPIHPLEFDPDFTNPPLALVKLVAQPYRNYFTPYVDGLEFVDPNRKTLFVTNHTIYGATDGMIFMAELFEKKKIFLRCLVDDLHYKIPLWKDLVPKLGFVRGTRENCEKLMQMEAPILVYPGGSRETFKNKDETYKLIWKNRTGFVRMAIAHGYDILPITTVGGDDVYKILFDSKDIMKSMVGSVLKASGLAQTYLKNGELIPPIAFGIGPTLIPRPVKMYIRFGQPIATEPYAGLEDDLDIQWKIRMEIEKTMNDHFRQLIEFRKNDPKKTSLQKWFDRK